jgi:phosphoribosyl-AMP cyclohydrolase / phosphoribosyl-ATP pyrophosphohydrolase
MTAPRSMTDRRIRSSTDVEGLTFDARGLLPVVTQDAGTGLLLMVAWANREALGRTLETGVMHYYSRSRDALWKKGETSGNTLELVSLHADCDADTVLARVRPTGPACHTGEVTCFGEGAGPEEEPTSAARPGGSILPELWSLIEARDRDRPDGSYTTRLLEDENLRIKKLGEEMAELIAALVRRDAGAAEEGADLIYHLLVALRGAGRSWTEVEEELARRKR